MKTRLITVLLALSLTLALTGCHKTENVEVSTVKDLTIATVTEVETTEAETTTEAADETTKATEKTEAKKTDLTGSWSDSFSQRAVMDITGGKNGVYQIHVHWGSTAFESDNWTMTGTFDEAAGVLSYKDCTCSTVTLDENGNNEKTVVKYKNGSGKFLYKNGELRWQADNDTDVNSCVFSR